MDLLLVEDDDRARALLKRAIEDGSDHRVVAEAISGGEALKIIRTTQIDALITAVRMAGMDGITLTRAIKRYYPPVHVVALSGHPEYEASMRAAGASGFVGRGELEEVVLALEVLDEMGPDRRRAQRERVVQKIWSA